ncbi:TPA: right-handed parallel beta-helix repeat-containing protein, partial [bacterium]|nr:right-handed parallel beta-helix repeat-containing protein [bacterium]
AVVGFTIRNANSIGDHPNVSGGGFSCFAISSPTIRNNIIINNISRHGGGIFCDQSSSPKIIGNVIMNNTALMDGGGICCTSSSSPLIINNVISDNKAPIGGGVICGWRNSSPKLINNLISGNSSDEGGGIFCTDSLGIDISGNVITKNVAKLGGGLYFNNASPNLVNNLIARNFANQGSEILYRGFPSKLMIMTNNTIVGHYQGNLQTSSDIIRISDTAFVKIFNTIIWNYGYPEPSFINCSGKSIVDVSYSSIWNGSLNINCYDESKVIWRNGNISSDPKFVNADKDDYRLSSKSVCINAGLDEDAPLTDIDGKLRYIPLKTNPDIGAYESLR